MMMVCTRPETNVSSSLQRLVQVLCFGRDPAERKALVLTASTLQKWMLQKEEDTDTMFYSCDVEEMAREAFAANIWVSDYCTIGRYYLGIHRRRKTFFYCPINSTILVAWLGQVHNSCVVCYIVGKRSED